MPFGAAETMTVHEILSEKICMLDHFALYASQAQDPMLRQMIQRHMQSALDSYNQMVAYTHDYRTAQPNLGRAYVSPQQVQYGLRNPSPDSPTMQAGRFNDKQIASAALSAHKNSAKNHMAAALECADPNLRQMMINASVACCNQAYEVFIYMNQRGLYQVPTMDEHTAKTYMHHYQPAGQGMNAQQMQQTQQMPGMGQNPQSPQKMNYQGNPFLM